MQYDAFISYKHNELDGAVAEALHKRLEHYHIPREIRQICGKKKISRIFRDKEELPLSANLTENIYEALDNSEFLILLCSPESLASLWVQREVSYFAETHDRQHILLVLVRGTPDTAFPRFLCERIEETTDEAGNRQTISVPVEPLAADVTGKDVKESLGKLKTETLRLVAAMLSCPYDGLKRRHREYIIRRTSAACAVFAAALICFFSYAYYQQVQLDLEETASLKKEAEYLAEAAVEALNEGDRETALTLATSVSLEDDEPASMLQLYALTRALYSFQSGAWLEYAPVRSSEIEDIEEGMYSEDGTYYYARSESDEGYVFEAETGTLLYQIDTDLIAAAIAADDKTYDDSTDPSVIRLILPYEEHAILVVTAYAGCIMDAETGSVIYVFPMSYDFDSWVYAYDLQGDIFAFCLNPWDSTGYIIQVYDLAAGTELFRISLAEAVGFEGDHSDLHIEQASIAVNTAVHEIAFSVVWNDYYDQPEGCAGLILYDYEEGTIRQLSDAQAEKTVFLDDETLAVLHREDPAAGSSTTLDWSYYTYYLSLYDVSIGEQLCTGEKMTMLESVYEPGILLTSYNDGSNDINCVVYWLNGRVVISDLETAGCLGQLEFDSTILQVEESGEGNLIAATEDGWVQKISISGGLARYDLMNLTVDASAADFFADANQLAFLIEGSVVFCGITVDENMTECVVSEDSTVYKVEYLETEERVYRCVYLDSYYTTTAVIYETQSEESLYTYTCAQEGYYIAEIEAETHVGTDYLYVTEKSTAYSSIAVTYTVNLSTGEVEEAAAADEEEAADNVLAAGTVSGRICLSDGETLTLMDAEGEILSEISLSVASIGDAAFFAEDEYLLLASGNTVLLYEVLTGNLMDSLTFETTDEVLNQVSGGLYLITDSSSTYFALKDTSFRATPERNINKQLLIIFTVDEEQNLNLYAEVNHGYASFAGNEVAVRCNGSLYFTTLYDYADLKAQAEAFGNGESIETDE